MESNLFIELAEEQQEMVAGGALADTLDLSAFSAIVATRGVATVAGPGGAGTLSSTNFAKIDSTALSTLGFEI